MEKILHIVLCLIFFSSLSWAQTMNIHTTTGIDVYNLADIDSITFTIGDTSLVTDIDGNVYHTVKIGGQVWMMENLKVTHYRNGEPIPNVTDGTAWGGLTTGAYCIYNNDTNNVNIYGLLYNWHAVNDIRGLAPAGWHVPSDDEWQILVDFLGGWYNAGGAMKALILWQAPNAYATNSSGFSALPAGGRYTDGSFDLMGYATHFWSSSEYSIDHAWCRQLSYNTANIFRIHADKLTGFSIRCVRD